MLTNANQGDLNSIRTTRALVFGSVDGIDLSGDFYRPASNELVPIVVAVHGGAWKLGSAEFYQHWGPYLAARGIAVFAIDYRLVEGSRHRYPAALDDVYAAIRFAKRESDRLGIDPERIGLVGDSAGAHLAALAALAGDQLVGSGGHPIEVKAVVGVYGVYDLVAQWQHDLVARPYDQITEAFIGHALVEGRLPYIAASPLTHISRLNRNTSFLVAWGTADDTVDWKTQSEPFVTALKQAGCFVRTAAISDAPHFWMSDPLDDPYGYSIRLAPTMLRFLRERL